MFDLWFGIPRWIRAGISLAILGYSAYLWSNGWIWGWGWAMGICLLALSFHGPLGPQRENPWRSRNRTPD